MGITVIRQAGQHLNATSGKPRLIIMRSPYSQQQIALDDVDLSMVAIGVALVVAATALGG
jgi:hypothetical protein